jgi:hypothetical protein
MLYTGDKAHPYPRIGVPPAPVIAQIKKKIVK